ncbi:mini-chromosome maintenance replisome factor-domain-containing protein [Cubamyces lactineus]|nr:mini-chromosome maintenance replisome factor-domain-containing protein [Cubamyces lactineus]
MTADYRQQALENPTLVLRQLYQTRPSGSFPRLVAEHFQKLFESQNAFQRIPWLDVNRPPESYEDRTLVRFRAMVQDTSLSTEMYLSQFADGGCGGWGIYETDGGSSSSVQEVDYANLQECSVLWATSVPAESAWCKEELNGPRSESARTPIPTTSGQVSPRAHKYPHPDTNHVGVQVKIYDREGIDSYKSTDVVTFIGILSTEPCNLDQTHTAADVPTLHVLFSQRHSPTVLSRPFPRSERPARQERSIGSSDEQRSESIADDTQQVRDELISWIAQEALGGDRVAAEWILLSCISRVQSRHPPLLPPSLVISRFPPPPPVPSTTASVPPPIPTISAILRLLLPLTDTLPLSLDTLNKRRFVPESQDEDLHAGLLQLPQGTVVLITEGGVREGQLLERVQDIMDAQTLAYVFPYSQFTFPTDISCIVLSEGRKSTFFRTDLNVPLRASTSPADVAALYKPADEIKLPPAEKLVAFRDLVVGARSGKVQVPEPTSEHIQLNFVRERQGDRSLTADDLIRWMTVAKLYALSLHEPSLSIETWQRAKAFDDQRRAAIA